MTPSATIIADADQTRTVTDQSGRSIAVRRLNALDKLRLFRAAGPVLAQNHPWLGMALLAYSVVSIDAVPYPAPFNEQQIEAMVSRLGDDGIAAVATALQDGATTDVVASAGN